MFLLDTNVVSEFRKLRSGKADPRVADWADRVDANSLYISAITILELEIGILQRERKAPEQGAVLRLWFETRVLPAFDGRIFAVDAAVARCCARLHVPDPRAERDALIAATALVHDLVLATRNVRDFDGIVDLQLVDPWSQRR